MNLSEKRCLACEGGIAKLTSAEAENLLKKLDGWKISFDHKKISKIFNFKNYYQTMAFVNATAWISHHENHHPNLNVHYNKCVIEYTTHAVDGLTENDFICAAKIDLLTNVP